MWFSPSNNEQSKVAKPVGVRSTELQRVLCATFHLRPAASIDSVPIGPFTCELSPAKKKHAKRLTQIFTHLSTNTTPID